MNLNNNEKKVIDDSVKNIINALKDEFEKEYAKIKKAVHLQIGDIFYVNQGLSVYAYEVKAIAVQPDDSIVYNWKYRNDYVYTSFNEAVDALKKESDAFIDKVRKDFERG